MANILIYKAVEYKSEYFRIFSGVYNDFRNCAVKNYNFELEPLEYNDFIKSVNEELLHCIILLEDDIPTGFLVYTSLLSEGIELNLIHCIGQEDINKKRCILLEKFLELNSELIKERVVIYPMLGVQETFLDDIKRYQFNTVSSAVVSVDLSKDVYLTEIEEKEVSELSEGYTIENWNSLRFSSAVDIIHTSFKTTNDALFDVRFTSFKGTRDILKKITQNVYGTFLPSVTKVLLYQKKPVGVCFSNLTNEKIANIPLIAIDKRHRGKGLSGVLLQYVLKHIVNLKRTTITSLEEINATVDLDCEAAVKMYYSVNFKEKYKYSQAYRPV